MDKRRCGRLLLLEMRGTDAIDREEPQKAVIGGDIFANCFDATTGTAG